MKWHQLYSINFLIGLASSLAFTNIFINYQSVVPIYPSYDIEEVEDLSVHIPTSSHEEKKVPIVSNVKALVQDNLYQDVEWIEEDLQQEESSLNLGEIQPDLDFSPIDYEVKKAPLIIPVAKEENNDILVMAERMPLFPGCDLDASEEDRRTCTQEQLLSHLYNHIRYPNVAKDNGIEGVVVVEFVIDHNGRVTKIKVLRKIGGGCDQEVVRVIEDLPAWMPGKQNGRPVAVLYRIPVRFKIQE